MRLQDVYRREGVSLLLYVRQASLFASEKDKDLLARVNELADAESAALDRFANYLLDQRLPMARIAAFPTEFTNYNFVAVRKILPLLIEDHRRDLQLLENDRLAYDGTDREQIERLIEVKTMHLTEMEKLVGDNALTVAAI
jgi:hypothetical protein